MATKKLGKLFKKRDKKAAQKLGVDIQGMVNKFMLPQCAGLVAKDEYNFFWLAMRDDASDVDLYIHVLVGYLLDFMSKNTRLPFDAQVLLNTINFLVLRHPSDPHHHNNNHNNKQAKNVLDILNKWNKNRVKFNDQLLPAAKDVLGLLYKQRVQQDNGLNSLIIQCYQFYSHDQLSRIADYYTHPTILHVVGGRHNIGLSSGDKVCIWPYLKEFASRAPSNFALVMQNTLSKLVGISGQIVVLPKLAEISLLALLFMIRQLLSYTRVPDDSWLDKSIANLKKFYLWPVPYGSQARDLLMTLQKERIAPGLSVLHKVWRECRLPEIQLVKRKHKHDHKQATQPTMVSTSSKSASLSATTTNDDDDDDNENDDGNDDDEADVAFRPLYYLFDVDDNRALLYANVMKIDAQTHWGANYAVRTGPSAYISAVLMLNIIGHDCGGSMAELGAALTRLNANEIQLFYKQVMAIFTASASSNNAALARQSRTLGLRELSKQIIEHANEKSVDEEEEEEDEEDEDERRVLYTEDISRLHENEYRVELPVLHHTGIGCDLKKKEFPSPGQMASNEMLYPSNDVLAKLLAIFKNLHGVATSSAASHDDGGPGEPITLRFMIAGGNNILSGVATAYASLMRHCQPLLQHFEVEFFVLPYSRNHFAEWLARQDPWYNRHIYLPLESKLFVAPSLLPETRSKLTSHGHLHCVGEFYREMSEAYAREADQLVALRLWEVLCWEAPPYTKTPHQLIPCCLRVEIGKFAEKRGQDQLYQSNYQNTNLYRNRANTSYQQQNQNVDDDGYDAYDAEVYENGGVGVDGDEYGSGDYLLHHQNGGGGDYKYNDMDMDIDTFDYQPVALDIDWQPVDMLGRAHIQNIEQKSQYLDTLSLSSVPRYGDEGFPASPDKAGVIHLYCKVRDSHKKKKYQEYALLKNEPSQHVRSCVISSDSPAEKFFILVDDQIYGKFSKIKVQPIIDPITKDQVFMPIRTFFPVNV
eukprot:CAMPEP_0202695710 /NCGR_PEP_ID=MMETSP1385-20130828/9242_1 /ASSEMBLY_ACC=CAM_ASM_000861 /TAXON_ID=933848 /ORGANISM="Elphidium margaritaceum" /LENGTH=982 /DNA_ID=CAMNT_0049351787 /DNA_START=168 /DNA_END=3116 /DNA_ORIENTATION=+